MTEQPPTPGRRLSITKRQRETAAAVELISLCQTVTQDGSLNEQEVDALRAWLAENRAEDLPARDHLFTVVERILADGKVTPDELRELWVAIETILPPDVRSPIQQRRKSDERAAKAARRQERMEARAAERQTIRLEAESNRPLEVFDFMVAGVQYEGRDEIVESSVEPDDEAMLERDYDNQYSINAVAVTTTDGEQYGFVPESFAAELAPLLDAGHPYEAHVKKILDGRRAPIPVVVARVYRIDSASAVDKPSPKAVEPAAASAPPAARASRPATTTGASAPRATARGTYATAPAPNRWKAVVLALLALGAAAWWMLS